MSVVCKYKNGNYEKKAKIKQVLVMSANLDISRKFNEERTLL